MSEGYLLNVALPFLLKLLAIGKPMVVLFLAPEAENGFDLCLKKLLTLRSLNFFKASYLVSDRSPSKTLTINPIRSY